MVVARRPEAAVEQWYSRVLYYKHRMAASYKSTVYSIV